MEITLLYRLHTPCRFLRSQHVCGGCRGKLPQVSRGTGEGGEGETHGKESQTNGKEKKK